MLTRTTAFDTAIIDSQRIATLCEIYSGGSKVQDLLISDGNINGDINNSIRRRASITLTDYNGTLTPAATSDLLSPLTGNEIKLWRGLTYADGSTELLPQGVYGISDFSLDDSGEALEIRIEAFDRARKVSRSKLTAEYVIAAGTNYGTAIQSLISSRVTGLTYTFTSTTYTTPAMTLRLGADPWEAARKMAASIGMDLYFDNNGNCVLTPVVDPKFSTVVWSYKDTVDSMIMYINKRFTDEEVPSHVIVTGESSSNTTPVRGEAIDDVGTTTSSVYYTNDSSSPTRASGSYGDIVDIDNDSGVTTVTQARDAAKAKLLRILGQPENLQLLNIVHPAQQEGDVIYVERADSRVARNYFVDKVTIPMRHDRGMNLQLRRV